MDYNLKSYGSKHLYMMISDYTDRKNIETEKKNWQ